MKNILIVGAGFSGAVLARQLAEKNYNVTVIDVRDHVAGNAYDEYHSTKNVFYHKYGPHIFHTNNGKVFEFLSRFTKWKSYQHQVRAYHEGKYYELPVNANAKAEFSDDEILDIFFKPYTKKMWGVELEELDPSIKNRVKPRDDYNKLYFPNDDYQFMPEKGYTYLIKNMLDHKNIKIELNRSFPSYYKTFDFIYNCMPIDEYFNFEYGELPYRSIKFVHKFNEETYVHDDASVINLTTYDGPTRVTDWSKFPNSDNTSKMYTEEYPCDYRDNNYERYYPVKDVHGVNREKYLKYKELVNKDKMQFIGRCGQYVYIDMDMAVNSSLQIAEKVK
jgi:UDP-galactopyranose mutase